MKSRKIDFIILRTMRYPAACLIFLFGLCVLSCSPAYAQNKTACELLSKAEAEAILGVTLDPPKPHRALSLASRSGFHLGHG